MSANDVAPIIIKRKKVSGGDGHHGGAWKVAYADFVTAMMAFFMLMWLLNATTEVQRKGIADYFSPTIPINRISGGGDGMFGGTNIFSEEKLVRTGQGASNENSTHKNQSSGDTGVDDSGGEESAEAIEQKALESLQEMLNAASGESSASELALRHIVTKVTDEGLIVEIFDLPDVPLFVEDTVQPTQIMIDITNMIASVFGLVTNEVAVAGFTKSVPVVQADNPVWTLSSNRADQVRQLIQSAGLPSSRMQRVTGYADRLPVVQNPFAVRNNRIELILLRDPV